MGLLTPAAVPELPDQGFLTLPTFLDKSQNKAEDLKMEKQVTVKVTEGDIDGGLAACRRTENRRGNCPTALALMRAFDVPRAEVRCTKTYHELRLFPLDNPEGKRVRLSADDKVRLTVFADMFDLWADDVPGCGRPAPFAFKAKTA